MNDISHHRPASRGRVLWTKAEDAVIRKRYANGGAKPILNLLPGRSAKAIAHRAASLGVRIRLVPRGEPGLVNLMENADAAPGGCMLWRLSMNGGSPWWWACSKTLNVRRAVYEFTKRKLKAGERVWVTCVHDRCIAPAHIVATDDKGRHPSEQIAQAARASRRVKYERKLARALAGVPKSTKSEERLSTLEPTISKLLRIRSGDVPAQLDGLRAELGDEAIQRVKAMVPGVHLFPQASVFAWSEAST